MIVLDFKKALDKVDRDVLKHKLKWYNIDPDLIFSLLSNRKQCVNLTSSEKNQVSRFLELILGVPQGACTSSFLFNLMINDLPLVLKICNPILFADDSTLIVSCYLSELESTIVKIQRDLDAIGNWLRINRLYMNYDKVCYMVFGNISQEISLVMNNCPLKRVDHVKILGCIIDDKLDWKKQINHVSRKCFLSLSPLYSLRYTLSQKSRLNIVTATVLSKLYYAPCVWFNANKGIRCKINNIIRTCAPMKSAMNLNG